MLMFSAMPFRTLLLPVFAMQSLTPLLWMVCSVVWFVGYAIRCEWEHVVLELLGEGVPHMFLISRFGALSDNLVTTVLTTFGLSLQFQINHLSTF